MKRIIISADCSLYLREIDTIKIIIKSQIIPLIKYHFKVISIETNDGFVETKIDVNGIEPEKMNYLTIVNYCKDLYQTILSNHKFDISVACHT